MGLSAAPVQAPPVAGPSGSSTVPGVSFPAPPPIVLEDTDSDPGVQTLAVPFRFI